MAMTPLPAAPNRAMSQETFSTTADTFVAALPGFVTEANALEANVDMLANEAMIDATTATTQAGIATAAQASATLSEANALASANAAALSESNAASYAASAAANSVLQKYKFDTSTSMADPSTGYIRFDNAAMSSVTAIAVDAQTSDTGNPNILDWLLTFDDSSSAIKGQLILSESGSPFNFAIFNVTSLANNTGWVQINVTHVASSGSFALNDVVVMDFKRTGDAGTGDVTLNGVQTLTNKTLSDPKLLLGGTNGTSGQVLTSAGAGVSPTWGTLPVDDSLNFIAKLTPTNGAASIAQTGIASYKSILIIYQGISISASANIRFQFSVDNGNVYSSARNFDNDTASTLTGRDGFAQIYLANSLGEIKVAIYSSGAGSMSIQDIDNSITGVINALRFATSAGTFAGAGSFYIYGIK